MASLLFPRPRLTPVGPPSWGPPNVACRFLEMAMSPVVILEIFLSILRIDNCDARPFCSA